MYGARQNKEKVSRRISKSESNNKRNRMNINNILQLAKSSVYVNDREISSTNVSQRDHAEGGRNHAEQLSWSASLNSIEQAFNNNEINNVNIKFVVNSQICEDCQNWFEETAYPCLVTLSNAHQNKNFTLSVKVGNQEIPILGKDFTEWPETIGAVKKTTKLDRLKSYIRSWGGLDTKKFFYYTSDMEICDVDDQMAVSKANLNLPVGINFSDIDILILSREKEIENSYNMYKEFQDTAMALVGNRRSIDFKNLGQKNKPQFSH